MAKTVFKPSENPRKHILSVRVTDAEMKVFERIVKRRGITMTDLLRERLCGTGVGL